MSVICIVGRPASGKTTIAKTLRERTGWDCGNFGAFVREQVQSKGIPATREDLQLVGQRLVEGDVTAFCRGFLAWCGWKPGDHLIADGLRHNSVYRTLRECARPDHIYLFYVDINPSIRLRRLQARGEADLIDSLSDEPTEKEVTSLLVGLADLTLDGSADVSHSVDIILQVLGAGGRA